MGTRSSPGSKEANAKFRSFPRLSMEPPRLTGARRLFSRPLLIDDLADFWWPLWVDAPQGLGWRRLAPRHTTMDDQIIETVKTEAVLRRCIARASSNCHHCSVFYHEYSAMNHLNVIWKWNQLYEISSQEFSLRIMQGSSPICLIAGIGTRDPSPVRCLYVLATTSHPDNLLRIFTRSISRRQPFGSSPDLLASPTASTGSHQCLNISGPKTLRYMVVDPSVQAPHSLL